MKATEAFFKKIHLVKCYLLKISSEEDVKMLYKASKRCEEALCSPANPNPVTRGLWQPTVELSNSAMQNSNR